MSNKTSAGAKLEMRRNAMIAQGLVSERMPGVSNIVLRMTYFQRTSEAALMTRTVNFLPQDYACFHMACVSDGCVNGGFDLAPVVSTLVKKRQKAVKGKLSCCGKKGSVRGGHASIAYEVSVQYQKPSKRA